MAGPPCIADCRHEDFGDYPGASYTTSSGRSGTIVGRGVRAGNSDDIDDDGRSCCLKFFEVLTHPVASNTVLVAVVVGGPALAMAGATAGVIGAAIGGAAGAFIGFLSRPHYESDDAARSNLFSGRKNFYSIAN